MPLDKQELFYQMHQDNEKIDDMESRREYDTNQELSLKMHQRYQQKKNENHKQQFESHVMKTWDFHPVLPEYHEVAMMLEET